MKTQVIIEALDLIEAQIDIDNRTVRQRLIAAGKSKNNRVYGESVLEAATGLFEGRQTYANHPSRSDVRDRPERSVRDLTGWLTNVEYREGALWATRHFTRNQAGEDTWALVREIVEGRAPASLLGASINAVGKASSGDDGALIVEAITAVNSVDDVTTPAAGGGWEMLVASDSDSLTHDLLQALTFEEWFQSRPDFVRRVQNEMKTVRQDKALTEATALAERLQSDLNAAQGQIEALESARVADAETITALRRECDVWRIMEGITLPADWKTSLRETLLKVDVSAWADIIESERRKARSAGHRVPVTGAGQRVNNPLPVQPLNTIEALRQRLGAANSPEEHAAIVRQIMETSK